jgi:allophanate hydrolase subunit 2
MSVMTDVLRHLQQFADGATVEPTLVHVRFTLADDTSFVVQGLTISPPAHGNDFWMIQGAAVKAAEALLIREEHVWKVEFAAVRGQPRRIGLHAELAPSTEE